MAFLTKVMAVALALATLSPCVSASEFLTVRAGQSLQEVSRELIESTLAAELSTDSALLDSLQSELRPMFKAMPKNQQGALEPAAVRYALHRYFVQKHGWYVKGLEPSGQAWNGTEATSVMVRRVPAYIQGLFEKRLHGQGMGLRDLAVFAATLLDFVHNQALSDVMDLYSIFNISTTTPVGKKEVDQIVKAYIMQLLDMKTISSLREFNDLETWMQEDFPGWGDFQMWVQDVREEMSRARSRRSFQAEEFTVESVVEEVWELNDRLGSFQDIECRSLKAALTDLEYKGTGRVLLSDFYKAGLKGDFLFNEHTDFLRRLGVLDESNPKHPSIIVANYLASQANCLASTSFHTVCCIDECEGLMGHLERSIAAPSTSPESIAALVANLESDTVSAPRNLSSALLARLGEIAKHHGGAVPLHGRLFAQWMHHAYPLECPFPHATGSTSPLTADEWMDAFGADEVALAEDERAQFIKDDKPMDGKEELPWLAVEELVVSHTIPPPKRWVRKIGACAAVMAFAVLIMGAWSIFTEHAWSIFRERQGEKSFAV